MAKFSSFLYQNRNQFSISFFLFALLFLIFDLEIVLIYPYVVSAYNNSIYGLVIVLVFLAILTAGFVYELGRGALKINSRQSNNLNNISITPVASPSHFSSPKGFNKKLNLTQKRFHSTKSLSTGDNFWRKVNPKNFFDNDNPAVIVNNFFKNHPNFETAKDNINFELINSILSKTINNFNITKEEFDVLFNIKAIRLALPIENKDDLVKVVGKYVRGCSTGVAGAYVFTNKPSANKYVGSSISLANRLTTSYLGPKLGNRKIDLAIKEIGLKNFVLDIYLLPSVYYSATNKEKLRNLTLALEQILILLYNPSYNVLKGSEVKRKGSEREACSRFSLYSI